jgi:hypothetical protein
VRTFASFLMILGTVDFKIDLPSKIVVVKSVLSEDEVKSIIASSGKAVVPTHLLPKR